MKLRFFIDRPVFSGVISVVIVLLGVIAMFSLPVEQYPDIAPPTINVWASYPGANAETVQKAVIVPLEEAINGVEDMTYMTSTASNTGDASINIYFKQGANADMAAVNVQNRVNAALSQLPAEATKTGVTTEKQQNAELLTFALYSPDDRFDQTFLNNYMKINVEPRLKRISGVGKAQLFGSNYSMRLWLKPDRMAQYGLIPDDISAVLARQNIEAATGSFGANHPTANEYTMKYRGRLSGADEFGELVVKSLPGGNVLRLKEVADVELGDEYYNYSSQVNGHPAAMMMINQKAGSNASSTINEIHEVLHELDRDLPEGAEFVVLTDTNKFLYASIRSVIRTLLEAILLVIVVVYVFLQDIKSTLIPAISIFVSIIGTFAVMSMIGFSINLLTLFALVLAIGTVVDDAIVVVEAVQAKFDEGYQSAVLAADDAMKDVSSAILTSTLYGSVLSRCHDGRHFGSLLCAVRHHDGGCRGHLGHQCLHPLTGTLRPVAEALYRRARQYKGQLCSPFPKGVQCRFLPSEPTLCAWSDVHPPPPVADVELYSSVLCIAGAAGQRHQDGPYPRRRHRNGHGEHEYEARHVNGADRQGDGAHQQPPRQYRRDRIQRCGCRLLFQRFRSVAGHVFRDTQRLGTA